jgi:hypothetical protein
MPQLESVERKAPWYDPEVAAAWLKDRPDIIHKLWAEFPPATKLTIDGQSWYVVGYNDDDSLLISRHDPNEDYIAAVGDREYLHAEHVREFLAAEWQRGWKT